MNTTPTPDKAVDLEALADKCSKAQDDGSVCGVDAGRTDYCNLSYLLETVEAALRSCHESITAAKHMLTECNQAIAVRDSANQSLRDQVAAYEPVILRIKQLQYAGIGDEPLVIVDTKRGPVPAALAALPEKDDG